MDPTQLKSLREERMKIALEMQSILDKAEAEKRTSTAEEMAKFSELDDKQEAMRVQIKAGERQQELDRELAAKAADDERAAAKAAVVLHPDGNANLAMRAFNTYLRSGKFMGEGVDEFRALQADADTEGGYLVAPELFVNQLIKFVDDQVFVRQHANVLSPLMQSAKLGVPSLDTDISDLDWTTELATGNEDSSLAFGKREMEPHPMARRIKVSNKLLQIGSQPPEQLVRERLGYKVGVTQEKAYLTGHGAGQPLGVYTASADGVPTSRDVSTDNTATSITFDGLIEAKYTLKPQYWKSARWNFHRDAVKQITKLKDGEGRYIWRPSVREGEPDRILEHPMDISEFAPNTFTTGLYVGMFCDWSKYWIVDSLQMQIQRLVELYAETNQAGFIARYEGDGAPVLAEAFVRVKLA
jgi:HK97 family phage major capsid protein|tara:strand:- start:4173 stop:5411 length:1239 start_codon:yes stop_codon:yes gene_type:complete